MRNLPSYFVNTDTDTDTDRDSNYDSDQSEDWDKPEILKLINLPVSLKSNYSVFFSYAIFP